MYCVEIWGNAKESYLNPLIKLQKRSVCIITHSHYRSHTESLFSKLDIPPFGKLVQYSISLTMFTIYNALSNADHSGLNLGLFVYLYYLFCLVFMLLFWPSNGTECINV